MKYSSFGVVNIQRKAEGRRRKARKGIIAKTSPSTALRMGENAKGTWKPPKFEIWHSRFDGGKGGGGLGRNFPFHNYKTTRRPK